MSTQASPVVSQDDSAAPQSGIRGFLSKLANAFVAIAPSLQRAGEAMVEAGGSPQQQSELNAQKQFGLEQQSMADRRAQLQSQLATADVERQKAQQEVSGYETPAQKRAAELDTQKKILDLQRESAEPQLIPVADDSGKIRYYQRKYNQATNGWDITPADVTTDQILSSPASPRVPYDPTQTITQTQRSQLMGVNPKVLENKLDLDRQIAFATNPDVQKGKIDVARAEGAARADVENAQSRGSNAALAHVAPHLVVPAAAAAEKAGSEYADAVAAARDMGTFVDLAKAGNKIAYSYSPTEGVLTLNTGRGVKRVNMSEIESYGGAGSAFDRVEAFLGKQASGASIPDDVLNDMATLHQSIVDNAKQTYASKLKVVNQNYGSSFSPVDIDLPGNVSKTPPRGATGKARGADGKLHWADEQGNDYGLVQ